MCVCVFSNHIGPSLQDNSISVCRYRSTLMDLHDLITIATGQLTSAAQTDTKSRKQLEVVKVKESKTFSTGFCLKHRML